MRSGTIILMFIIGLLALCASSVNVEAQSAIPSLPHDLLFVPTITEGEIYFSRNTILRIDAETLEVSPFYVDNDAWEVMPLIWSPDGELLVIYRILSAEKAYSYTTSLRQLCFLDRKGMLQQCLNDRPPIHYVGRPVDWQYYYPIVWGPDGQTIYFDTEYPIGTSPNGYGRRLIESSVTTGETLRIVYDYPDAYAVTPSPDLNHLAVGFGEQWFPGSPYVLDLTTGSQFDLSILVPVNTWLSETCLPFSPNGQFIATKVGYKLTNYAPEIELPDDYREGEGNLLLLLDVRGNISHVVGEPEGSPATMWYHECPGWQPDEQAIVFYAWGAEESRIMRYSLADQQTTTLYAPGFGPGREPYVYSPLIPSPDGTHVALTVSDGPYEDRLVAVLYPDGQIYRIPSPNRFGLYPLWVPANVSPEADAGADK